MTELFNAGFQLTLTGMTTVFVLLGILVLAVRQMSRLAQVLERRYGSQAFESTPGASAAALPIPSHQDLDEELVTAISAAVYRYRRSNRKP